MLPAAGGWAVKPCLLAYCPILTLLLLISLPKYRLDLRSKQPNHLHSACVSS